MIQCSNGHRTLEIPDFIDEELFLKAVSGEKIVEDEDQGDECCKVSSSRQGKKGKNICCRFQSAAREPHRSDEIW